MRQGSVSGVPQSDWTAPRREEWQDDALCAETDPELFFPEKGGSTADPKSICAECDVREQCLAYALEHQITFGVFGGTSARDRAVLKAADRGVFGRLIALNGEGLSDRQVATELGWSVDKAKRVRRGLGLSAAHRGGRPRKVAS